MNFNLYNPGTFMMAIDPMTSSTLAYPVANRQLNLDPVIPIFRRILSDVDFVQPFKTAVDVFDSGPFTNACLVSLKSAPYAYRGDLGIVKEFDNGVSCRLRYFESAVTSLAAVVYNSVFGLIFSALSLVTLGQVKLIINQMHKHWVHSALAVAAVGISCAGTVSPDLGIKTNLAAAAAVGVALMQWMQGDVITKICTAYQRENQALKQAVAQACMGSEINFEREFTPLFNHLDSNLNNRVKTFPEFANVIQNAIPLFPRVTPTVSSGVIANNLQLASNWRGVVSL